MKIGESGRLAQPKMSMAAEWSQSWKASWLAGIGGNGIEGLRSTIRLSGGGGVSGCEARLSKMSLSRWKADQRWRAWRTGWFMGLG